MDKDQKNESGKQLMISSKQSTIPMLFKDSNSSDGEYFEFDQYNEINEIGIIKSKLIQQQAKNIQISKEIGNISSISPGSKPAIQSTPGKSELITFNSPINSPLISKDTINTKDIPPISRNSTEEKELNLRREHVIKFDSNNTDEVENQMEVNIDDKDKLNSNIYMQLLNE